MPVELSYFRSLGPFSGMMVMVHVFWELTGYQSTLLSWCLNSFSCSFFYILITFYIYHFDFSFPLSVLSSLYRSWFSSCLCWCLLDTSRILRVPLEFFLFSPITPFLVLFSTILFLQGLFACFRFKSLRSSRFAWLLSPALFGWAVHRTETCVSWRSTICCVVDIPKIFVNSPWRLFPGYCSGRLAWKMYTLKRVGRVWYFIQKVWKGTFRLFTAQKRWVINDSLWRYRRIGCAIRLFQLFPMRGFQILLKIEVSCS